MRNLFVLFIVASLCVTMFGCPGDSEGKGKNKELRVNMQELGKFEGLGLDKETEQRILEDYILQDYYEKLVKQSGSSIALDDIKIERFYGIYDGCVALTTNWDSYDMAVIRKEKIGDVVFTYGGWTISAWHDGNKYNLKEAFDQKLLTSDNLIAIKEKFEQSEPKD